MFISGIFHDLKFKNKYFSALMHYVGSHHTVWERIDVQLMVTIITAAMRILIYVSSP